MRALLSFALLALFAPLSPAATLVVDENGEPGVYTDIQSALDAATPGDVVIVQPGTYAGYTLSIGVTLVGAEPQPDVTSDVLIQNVPAGQVAVVSNIRQAVDDIDVIGCDGTVVLDRLVLWSLMIEDSADVRAFDLTARSRTHVTDARFEATRSSFRGADGYDGVCFGGGGPGSPGLSAFSGAVVHLSLSDVEGGEGGHVDCAGPGGDGGSGVYVDAGAQVFVTGGDGTSILGGQAGFGDNCSLYGEFGDGAVVLAGGLFVYSNAIILGGSDGWCGSGDPFDVQGGAVLELTPDAPTLDSTGATPPGGTSIFTVRAPATSPVFVALGTTPVDIPVSGWPVGLRTSAEIVTFIGVIGGSGQFAVPVPVPTFIPPGELAVAQAAVFDAGGQLRFTSSVPWIVQP